MKTINDLLDAIKQRRGLETDSALAAALGVKRQTVNNWRQGRNTPDAVACATIAGLSGEPLALVIGIAGEQRAVSAEEKKVWRRLAASAAVITLLIGSALPSIAHAATPAMQATQSLAGEIVQGMHYAKWMRLINVPHRSASTAAGMCKPRRTDICRWRVRNGRAGHRPSRCRPS